MTSNMDEVVKRVLDYSKRPSTINNKRVLDYSKRPSTINNETAFCNNEKSCEEIEESYEFPEDTGT